MTRFAFLLALLALGGCPFLQPSIPDSTLSLSPIANNLLLGGKLVVPFDIAEGNTLESSDPGVIAIVPASAGNVALEASGLGSASILVRDAGGDELDRFPMQVFAAPTAFLDSFPSRLNVVANLPFNPEVRLLCGDFECLGGSDGFVELYVAGERIEGNAVPIEEPGSYEVELRVNGESETLRLEATAGPYELNIVSVGGFQGGDRSGFRIVASAAGDPSFEFANPIDVQVGGAALERSRGEVHFLAGDVETSLSGTLGEVSVTETIFLAEAPALTPFQFTR